MLRRCIIPALTLAVVLAACSPETTPTAPIDDPIGIGLAPAEVPSNPYCEPTTTAEIEAMINALFATPGWPNANSATAKLKNVNKALAKGDLSGAIAHARGLVDFINLKYGQLTAAQQAAVEAQVEALNAAVLCVVGLSGEVFDLNPTDPAKAFVVEGESGEKVGVWFPPAYVPVGTIVTLTEIPDTEDPLDTPLDKYPTYLDVRTYPAVVFDPENLPVVAVCLPDDIPADAAARAYLGHQTANGFELLERQAIPPELFAALGCSGAPPEPTSFAGKFMAKLANLFLPEKLQAKMYAFGGVGGSPEEFSPFGAVDGGLEGRAAGGVGGSPEEFAPPPQFGPMAGPAATPPVPDGTISGPVGSTASGPSVEVRTMGEETPIEGVAVRFTIQPASGEDYGSNPGNAQLCEGAEEVVVETDEDGKAALDCLEFGTIPGYSNIKATFDPSTLTFPGAELVFIGEDGDISPTPGYSVNFLVEAAGLVDWQATGYQYLLTELGGESETQFYEELFDASGWSIGAAPFGSNNEYSCELYNAVPSATIWPLNSDVLVRKTFVLAEAAWVQVRIAIDNDVAVWLNGDEYTSSLGAPLLGGLAKHEGCATRPDSGAPFTFIVQAQAGANLLAIRARDRGVIGYFDVMVEIVPEPQP